MDIFNSVGYRGMSDIYASKMYVYMINILKFAYIICIFNNTIEVLKYAIKYIIYLCACMLYAISYT